MIDIITPVFNKCLIDGQDYAKKGISHMNIQERHSEFGNCKMVSVTSIRKIIRRNTGVKDWKEKKTKRKNKKVVDKSNVNELLIGEK